MFYSVFLGLIVLFVITNERSPYYLLRICSKEYAFCSSNLSLIIFLAVLILVSLFYFYVINKMSFQKKFCCQIINLTIASLGAFFPWILYNFLFKPFMWSNFPYCINQSVVKLNSTVVSIAYEGSIWPELKWYCLLVAIIIISIFIICCCFCCNKEKNHVERRTNNDNNNP